MKFTKIITVVLLCVTFSINAETRPKSIKLAQAPQQITSGELVKLKKLIRDMKGVHNSISTTGPSKFQNATEVSKYTKRFNQFSTAITRFNKYGAPEVKVAHQEYLSLRTTLTNEFKRAKTQQSNLGDVQAVLKDLEKDLFANRAPKTLNVPFSSAQAKAWVYTAITAKKSAQKSQKKLTEISQAATLEKSNMGTVQQGYSYDKQDLNRLSRFSQQIIARVDQSQKDTMNGLKTQINATNNELDYFRKLDPKNPTDQANAFLKEGAPEDIMTRLDDKHKVVLSAAHFLSQFGKKPNKGTQSLIDEIAQLKIDYSKNLEIAAGAYKMPKPKSTNKSMLAMAKDIIEKKRYGFGEHGPIVLTTAEIVDREREESEEKFSDIDVSLSGTITLHGTKTTWHYKWKEFKFATPIKSKKGDWYVWWITARNFSSGGMHTPLNEWVAGKSSQGSIIKESNF